MDDEFALEQQLEQEIVFLRNLFRVAVQNDDSQAARDEIASRILIVSSQLNDLVNNPVEAFQPWGPLQAWQPSRPLKTFVPS